jgi:carbonic anhydrase
MNITTLLQNNQAWVNHCLEKDPEYFGRRAEVHKPHFLWIGCSDARVPANQLTGTAPGEIFVHRNIANQVMSTDANVLAVIQYAVEALGVQDIIVTGHTECGGVNAALAGQAPLPHVQGWLSPLRMVARLYQDELEAIPDQAARAKRLVQLNVVEQVRNLSRTPVVEQAWAAGRTLRLHGWMYDVHFGRIEDLGVSTAGPEVTMSSVVLPPSMSRRREPVAV